MNDALYFHRKAYAEQLTQTLKAGITHSFTLFAPRRMGKTQFLLKDMMPLAEQEGFNVFYFSFMGENTQAIQDDFRAALMAFNQKIQVSEKVTTFFNKIKKVDVLGVGLERVSSDKEVYLTINDIIHLIAQDNRPSLLLLDEVQELARIKDTEGIVRSLRTGLDIHQDKIKTVFTGSSINGLKMMFNDNKAPFFHFSHHLDFPLLDKQFTDFLADVYYQRVGKKLNKKQLFAVFKRLHYTPMYMRAIIQDMIITPTLTLEKALESRIEALGQQYAEKDIWSQLKPLEQLLLKDIAYQTSLSIYSKQIQEKYARLLGVDVLSASSIQSSLKRLERSDIITQVQRKQWQINSPLLQTWIRENVSNEE
ncbi:ATP-binding protein [Pelistega sp. NLN82]|uniref:ATP-binding protein n=1 Tax=Pelistega ratti TaxID=2652177 RepID=A0A6L9Y6Z2_9BURK|nr:ATP-binding protein [Pelistega ratti]NEN76133.1 ATP-binding protein [Pelistega ratti]